jgi:hypothetical protein
MDDKELDDLLDSALEDFDKKPPIVVPTVPPTQSSKTSITIEKTNLYVDDIDYDDRPAPTSLFRPQTSTSSSSSAAARQANLDEDMKMFEQIFGNSKTKESMKFLKDSLNTFKEGDETKLLDNFEKVMSQITDTFNIDENDENDTEDLGGLNEKDIFDNFSKLLGDMKMPVNVNQAPKKSDENKKAEELNEASSSGASGRSAATSSFFNAEFLAKLNKMQDFDSGTSEGDDDLNEAEAMMMEPLLNMLFSKDILYPSLKMMQENFDKYLEEKKEKLSEEELKKLEDQKGCIKEMCLVYENTTENDSKQEKSAQLKKIVDLLEKCGVS